MPRVLQRAGSKGVYVLWPKDWPKQWRDPLGRRFQSGCDMLLGYCQCGRVHTLDDGDVMDNLSRYDSVIESHADWRARTLKERNVANVS